MQKKNYFISAFIVIIALIFLSGCETPKSITDITDNNKTEDAPKPETAAIPQELGAKVPAEFMIYQDYLNRTNNYLRGTGFDTATIEATVISTNLSAVCPDINNDLAEDQARCSVEPYPKDGGKVRIDKIVDYTEYFSGNRTMEGSAEIDNINPADGQGEVVPGSPGTANMPTNEYEPLQEGQEVFTNFVLTARSVKVVYASREEESIDNLKNTTGAMESGNNEIKSSSGFMEGNSDETVDTGSISAKKSFKPIPKDGDYFVFTTQYNMPQTIEKILPGLKAGDKFRAQIKYDGALWVEEYQKF